MSPDIKSPPGAAARTGAGQCGPARAGRLPRAARLAAALAGLIAVIAYLAVALSRIRYPFALQELEGNSLIEVQRILAGQPLYPAPSAEYVPDGYTPLYFYASAGVAKVFGLSYFSLRLVSVLSSLACFAVLARLVQRETGSLAAGTGAAGVFAATYFAAGAWFDIGRVDSLFLALSIGGLYAVRVMRGAGGAVAAGLLLAGAALTKQTGLAEATLLFAVLLLGPRRRLGYLVGLTAFTVMGAAVLLLRLDGGGWFTYYVFKQMSEHKLTLGNFGWFGTALLSLLGLAACAAVIGARRVPREVLVGCAAFTIEGGAALIHSGGAINDMMPVFLAVALLAGLALGRGEGRVAVLVGLLILAQSVFLLATAHPSRALATSADRAAGEQLVAGMRAFGGDVVAAGEPALNIQAGMSSAAHPSAVYDVLRATDQTGIESFRNSALRAIAARRFSAFIDINQGPPLFNPANLDTYYHMCVQASPTLFVPWNGTTLKPAVLWIPWHGMSCQAAFRIFDNAKAGS